MTEPCFDIAHLAHVEMYTDKFEESLAFFVNVYGLTVSSQDETSAYLRAYDDYEFHTLKLTRHHTTGVGHIAYRASSPEALERRVKAIEASGYKVLGWVEGDKGHDRLSGSRTRSAMFSRSIGTRCATKRLRESVQPSRISPSATMGAAPIHAGLIT